MDTNEFKDLNIVVSGGMGFIGSNLTRALVDAGAHVSVVDNQLPEHGANLFNLNGYQNRVRLYIHNICSPDFPHLLADADVFYNLAAQTSHIGSMIDPILDIDVNARNQLTILEFCRLNNPKIHIVYTSTRQVYGRPVSLPVDESHHLKPLDINGVNKLAAENYFRLYHEIYGLKTTILRLTNTYGPRMGINSLYQGFIGAWVRNLILKKPIEIWDGSLVRDFNYVDDVVEGLLKVTLDEQAVGQIFNLGGERASLRDLSNMLLAVWGSGEVITSTYPDDRKKIAIGNIYLSYEKLNRMVGWEPKTSLMDGLKMTLNYYRCNAHEYLSDI